MDGRTAHERMLNIIVTREMQIKRTMRYHYIRIRMTKIKDKS